MKRLVATSSSKLTMLTPTQVLRAIPRKNFSVSTPLVNWIQVKRIEEIIKKSFCKIEAEPAHSIYTMSGMDRKTPEAESVWSSPSRVVAKLGTSELKEIKLFTSIFAEGVEASKKSLIISLGCRECDLEQELVTVLEQQGKRNVELLATDIDPQALVQALNKRQAVHSGISLRLLCADVHNIFPLDSSSCDAKIVILAHRFFTVLSPHQGKEVIAKIQPSLREGDYMYLSLLNIGSPLMTKSFQAFFSEKAHKKYESALFQSQDYKHYLHSFKSKVEDQGLQKVDSTEATSFLSIPPGAKPEEYARVDFHHYTKEISFCFQRFWEQGKSLRQLVVTYRDPKHYLSQLKQSGWQGELIPLQNLGESGSTEISKDLALMRLFLR